MYVLRIIFFSACIGLVSNAAAPASAQEDTPDGLAPEADPPPAEAVDEAEEADAPDDTTGAEAEAEAESPEPAEKAEPADDDIAPVDPSPAPPASAEAVPEEPAAEAAVEGEVDAEAEEEDEGPTLSIGIGMRTGLAMMFDPPEDGTGLTLHDGLLDQVHLRPYFSGQLTENIGFSANFEVGTGSEGALPSFSVLDAILQLKIVDELQVWIGQMIPAADRSNTNGPFYHNSWNFPITIQTYPFDVSARDRGVTVWGMIADGLLQYHVSAVDLQPGQTIQNARYSGRLSLQLLEPEAFYYTSGTYYGEKDVLAIAAVGHYQNGRDGVDEMSGEPLDNDFLGFSFDLLFEKNLGSAGTFTVEGGYKNFEETGDDYAVNQGTINAGSGVVGPSPGSSYLIGVSWLTPEKIGLGKIQPNARFQAGDYGEEIKTLDVGVGYIIDGFDHKWYLNYRHQDVDGSASNMLQLGVQVQMWN